MSKKIYVGNMNYNTDEDGLATMFAEFGEVISAKVIIDQFTGRSKGFGFIEMDSDEEAMAAIGALDGKETEGRNLKVSEAMDKPKRQNNNRRDNY